MPVLSGVDCYHGDTGVEFHPFAAAGCSFVFLKASQGVSEIDPRYADFYARAQSVGLVTGAYHFFTDGDSISQARHFLDTANLTTGDLVPALDVETAFPGVGDAAKTCATEIKRLTGRWPILYASDSFYRSFLASRFPEGDFTLWIARYGNQPVTPCAFWQWSESARISGEPGPLDTDVFFGTMTDLKAHCL